MIIQKNEAIKNPMEEDQDNTRVESADDYLQNFSLSEFNSVRRSVEIVEYDVTSIHRR